MIMNNMGGGSSSGGGVSTRQVGLGEIFFTYNTDSILPGYRCVFVSTDSSSRGYRKFYFPGKVIKVLSFKYRIRYSYDSAFAAETTFTGNWTYFGNYAVPDLYFTSTNKYWTEYAVTELIALIEDEASGGTTTSITVSASDLYAGKYVKLPSNVISFTNLTSSAAIPSYADSKAALVREVQICGSLLYVKGLSADITVNVKLAENNETQGILVYDGTYYTNGGKAYGISFPTGFMPKVAMFCEVWDPNGGMESAQDTPSGQWNNSFIKNAAYNNLVTFNGQYLQASGVTVTYNDTTGYAHFDFSATYGEYLGGTYHILAVG